MWMTTPGKRSSSLTKRDEKQQASRTALVVAAVLMLLSGFNLYRGRTMSAEIMGAVAGILAVIGLAIPGLAIQFHRGWMGLAAVLGFINSRILLTIIYFIAVTPIGLLCKLF